MLTDIDILIVEDSPTQAVKLQYDLEWRGCRVTLATDGKKAVACMDKHKPDIVVSDIIMPEMNGYELCRHIKASPVLADVPVILLTALSDPHDILRALDCGADNFVTKPYKPEVLYDRIDRVLAARAAKRDADSRDKIAVTVGGETRALPSSIQQIASLLNAGRKADDGAPVMCDACAQEHEAAKVSTPKGAEEPYHTLFEMNSTALVVVAQNKSVLYANRAARTLLGYNGNVAGTVFDIPFSVGAAVEHAVVLPSGNEHMLTIRADETVWEGSRVHLVSLIDAADQQQTEETLRRAQEEEIRLRDEFLSKASHELRTPVAVVYQFVTILLDGLAGVLTPEQKEYLQIVFRNIEELKAMVDDLMDISRSEAEGWDIQPTPMDIVPLVRQAKAQAERHAKPRHINVEMDGPDTMPQVNADPRHVGRIVSNLVAHAARNTPEDGTIGIVWSAENANGECVRIAITDGGTPLTEQECQHVFDKMQSFSGMKGEGKQGQGIGLGLGLHIAKELVCRQGGTIAVQPGAEKGNTFVFTLPMAAQKEKAPAKKARKGKG